MKTIKYLLLATGLLALVAAPALANEPGTWILRGGAGTVQPDSQNLLFELGEESIEIDVDSATSMTLSELQRAHELILGKPFDKRNFRKKVLAEGLIEATGNERRSGPHRPARLYRVKHPSDVPYAPVTARAQARRRPS